MFCGVSVFFFEASIAFRSAFVLAAMSWSMSFLLSRLLYMALTAPTAFAYFVPLIITPA
ncbi:MAG: hypothetical protein J6M07_09870 [Ruminococcus sp.]|nr:hypothetical protein [Ruminococcus sp.]